ncbi:twin-arginine translocase subunit TatE [Candidatus Symbiopectobacterium sp.]|uniref:twin-arginine translocase subunit TatE n=1 Tax=Candidatus Symbiopectobacterium sp. TaxID=2816440 RepID=UPI0025BE0BC3|nr:twin-arginine translocase subunit TatE [Candidatus Symbiopectobacterium sp.]
MTEGISIAKLLVIAALIVLLFGTNKLRSLGGDLGAAIKGFKKAMNDDQSVKQTSTGDDAAPAGEIRHNKD